MVLEDDINETNQYYLCHNIAVIYKKPTPITIRKVDYPSRLEAVIKEAYFKIPSTTDYNGIYKGRYIDFEAKETKNKAQFPIGIIHSHQIMHLKKVHKHGGIGFFVIRFSLRNETFLVDAPLLIDKIEHSSKSSIPYSWFQEHGHLIQEGYIPRLDYLKIVDLLYFKEDKT